MRITIDIEPSPKKSILSDVAGLSPLLIMLWNMLRTSPSDVPPDIGACMKPDDEAPSPNPPTSGAV